MAPQIKLNFKYLSPDGGYFKIISKYYDLFYNWGYQVEIGTTSKYGWSVTGFWTEAQALQNVEASGKAMIKAEFEADLMDIIGIKKRTKEYVPEKPVAGFGWKRDHFNNNSGYRPNQISRKGSTGRIYGLPVHSRKGTGNQI